MIFQRRRKSSISSGAREEIGEYAPKIETLTIPTDKIRDVIGTGGKVIREIVATTGAKVDVSDDGTVKVSASDGAKIKAAIDWIKSLTSEPEIGAIYDGKVVKVVDFGAFVNFFGAKDGLVHVSQISKERVPSSPTSCTRARWSRSSCSASTTAARPSCR